MNTDTNKKLRVLFVSDHFGHAGGVIHGATRYFLTVLPRLLQRDVDLHVAFLRGEHPASEQIKRKGIQPVFFGRAKRNPLSALDVYRLVRRERIQVIHCAGMKGILASRIAGWLAGVPVVSHLHDCEPLSRSVQRMLRWTNRFNSWNLSVSKDVEEHGKFKLGINPSRSEVLHNGIVLDELQSTPQEAGKQCRESLGIFPDNKVIGIVGRLAAVKGHDTLLRAMPGVLAKFPNARLMIVGEGEEHERLNQRVHELGLYGYVTFTGQVQDVCPYLRAIDVVAMPSLREGLPYSLLEAMALDKPVVASAVGGLAETINHCVNGVLFRPNDAQALSEALISVLSDPLLTQIITHGAHETVSHYDIERHIDRIASIYRALAAGETVVPLEALHSDESDKSQQLTSQTLQTDKSSLERV